MKKLETATFGAGCFWSVEEVYRQTKGVKTTAVGFMGGTVKDPSYENVCSDNTGHAEVVHMEYDPEEITYEELLRIFWESHDPTTIDRQGPDVGSQYRSVIFFHTPEQEKLAKASKDAIAQSGKFKNIIVTTILPAEEFYKAEKHHQQYLLRHNLSSKR